MSKKSKEKKPRVIGYLRVSTADQDLEKNKADILSMANEKNLGRVVWVTEKVSGIKDWKKRKLGAIIKELKEGDVIIVPEISRMGRSTLDVLEVIKEVRSKGIAVYAVKNGWTLNDSMESKMVLMMLSMFAEIERDLISARTREALRARRAAGVRLGRPKGPGRSKLDSHKEEIIALLRNGSTKVYIAKKYGTTPANLYNWLRKNKLDIATFS